MKRRVTERPFVPRIRLRLDISAEEIKRYYAGSAATVLARSSDGRVLRFPASCVRGFVGHDGVHGAFVIDVDPDNRILDFRRVEQLS